MSQRTSGYERQSRDRYETPRWVTQALGPHLPGKDRLVWEPAAGSGKMVAALQQIGCRVIASDIDTGQNFLSADLPPGVSSIITNPPYELATEFITRALELTQPCSGFVAMLLRTDFDHAQSRSRLFAECSAFAKKVVLRKRIKWFEDSRGSPSFNHAWFLWDWDHCGAPTLVYEPSSQSLLDEA